MTDLSGIHAQREVQSAMIYEGKLEVHVITLSFEVVQDLDNPVDVHEAALSIAYHVVLRVD